MLSYQNRVKLINQLQDAMSPETEQRVELPGIEAVYNQDTKTIRYMLSGTEFNTVDLSAAYDYFKEQVELAKRCHAPQLEIKRMMIAAACVNAVTQEFYNKITELSKL